MSDPIPHMPDEAQVGYWLEQMGKSDIYAAVAAACGGCNVPTYAPRETIIAGAHKQCTILIHPKSNLGSLYELRYWLNDGAVIVQFRHGDSDWTKGSPELVTHPKRLGFVNIAGYLIFKEKGRHE